MTDRTDPIGPPHDLVAGFLVDALEDHELARFVDHLATCDACRAEVALLTPTVADLATTVEVRPPAALEASLMGALFPDERTDRRVPPGASAAPHGLPRDSEGTDSGRASGHRAHPRLWRRWMWPAAAVAAFVLGVGVTATTHPFGPPADQQTQAEAEMHQIMEIAAAPDAHVMPMDVPGATTRLVISHEMDKGAVLASDLPMPAKGREYHLWSVVDDGSMRSAAAFVPDPAGHVSAMLRTGVRDATAFLLTVEQPGATHPTAPPIAEVPI